MKLFSYFKGNDTVAKLLNDRLDEAAAAADSKVGQLLSVRPNLVGLNISDSSPKSWTVGILSNGSLEGVMSPKPIYVTPDNSSTIQEALLRFGVTEILNLPARVGKLRLSVGRLITGSDLEQELILFKKSRNFHLNVVLHGVVPELPVGTDYQFVGRTPYVVVPFSSEDYPLDLKVPGFKEISYEVFKRDMFAKPE